MFLFRQKFLIPLAIILSLIATYVVYQYLQKEKLSLRYDKNAPQPVVVAAMNLNAGVKIEEKHVQKVEWPRNILPTGTFATVADVLDRVTKTEVVAGEPILEAKLAPMGSSSGFSSLIPTGMRALTVSVNVVSGVSGFILPNARVDVLVTVVSSNRKEESSTKIILEDVQVLAVDQTFERADDEPVKVQSVTLLVTPEQSERLALASSEGKLQLVLRNSSDRNSMPTDGIQLKQLITGNGPANKPVSTQYGGSSKPAAKSEEQEKPKHVVEILRSNKREEVTFDKKEEQPTQPENP